MDATYVSANSFKVSGDRSDEFITGRRIKANCVSDGIKYTTVISGSYSAPDTTVFVDESTLTSNLLTVLYGVVSPGEFGSLPDHAHDGSEGSGGELTVSGSGASTLLELTDTPSTYDDGKFLKSTAAGTEWTTVTGTGGGTSDHSALNELDYASSGHTGFVSSVDLSTTSGTLQGQIDSLDYYTTAEVDTISGSLQTEIDGKSDVQDLVDLTDTPGTYDDGKYLRSTTSGTEWAAAASEGGVTTFSGLTDTPDVYVAGKLLQTTADGIEFVDASSVTSSVYARYVMSAGDTIDNASNTRLNFETVEVDTHNAVVTGTNWVFTVPEAGYYGCYTKILWDNAAWETGNYQTNLAIRVGGNTKTVDYFVPNDGGYVTCKGLYVNYCSKGTDIYAQTYQNTGAPHSLRSGSSQSHNYIVIFKLDATVVSGTLLELLDTPDTYDDGKYLRSTATGTEWATAASEGGVTTFSGLTDTPDVYDDGKYLRSTASGTEWADPNISMVTSDFAAYELVQEWDLNNETLSGTISWDGETHDRWYVEVLNADCTLSITMIINNDSGANYPYGRIAQDGSNVTGFAGTSSSIQLASSTREGATTYSYGSFKNTGQRRFWRADHGSYDSGNTDFHTYAFWGHWDNTADDVTSIQLYGEGVEGVVRLYRFTSVNLPSNYPYAGAGIQSIKVEYKDADEIYIGKGVIHINDGSDGLYSVESRFAKTLTGLSTAWWYIYAKPPTTGNVLTSSEIEYATTAPDKDLTKVGYYHPTNTSWRCIYAIDVNGTTIKVFERSGDTFLHGAPTVTLSNVTCTTSYYTADWDVPVFCNIILSSVRVTYIGTDINMNYRAKDNSATQKLFSTLNANSRSDFTQSALLVDDNQDGEFWISYGTSATLRAMTDGFIVPSEIYTGPVYTTISGGTSDVQDLLDLSDTPSAYDTGKFLRSTVSGTEWATAASDAGVTTFSGLTDTPDVYVAGKLLQTTASGIEFVDGSAITSSIYARYAMSAGATIIQNVNHTLDFETKEVDTHNAVTTGSGIWAFTAPEDGYYGCWANILWNSATWIAGSDYCSIRIVIAGENKMQHYEGALDYGYVSRHGFYADYCNKGDTIYAIGRHSLSTSHTLRSSNSPQYNYIVIFKLDGVTASGTVQDLLDLSDTPSTYDSGKFLRSTTSGTEWAAAASEGGVTTFSGLTDTPNTYEVGKYVISTASGVEFTDAGVYPYAGAGIQSIKVEYATTSGISINKGVVHINDGLSDELYSVETQFVKYMPSSTSSQTYYYVYAKPPTSSNVLTTSEIEFSTTVAVKDLTKGGYYHPSNTSWRCISAVMARSTLGEIYPFQCVNGQYMTSRTNNAGWINAGTTWTTITVGNIPFGDTLVFVNMMLNWVDYSGWYYVREYNVGGAQQYFGYVHSSTQRALHSQAVPVDSSFRYEVKWAGATTNTTYMNHVGFQMPEEIYTGPVYTTISGGTGSGSSDVQTFLDLDDTPTTYSGVEGQYLRTTASGIEFIDLDYYTTAEVDTISGSLQTQIDGHSHLAGVTTFSGLTDTPATYDTGKYLKSTASGTEWFDPNVSMVTSDFSAYELVQEWNLNNETLSGTLAWDGEIDDRVRIEIINLNVPTAATNVKLRINNDQGANYSMGYYYQDGSSVIGSAVSTNTSMLLSDTAADSTFNINDISLKNTGQNRLALRSMVSYVSGNDDYHLANLAQVWRNSVDDVTSLTFYSDATNLTGTVRVYRFGRVELPASYPYAGAGIQSIKVEYKDADEIYIGKGVVHINDGSDGLYSVEERFSKTLSGLSGTAFYYIYTKPPTTGNVITSSEIEYTTASGVLSYTKQGYYHPTNDSWRCISAVYVSSSNIGIFEIVGNIHIPDGSSTVGSITPSDTWVDITCFVPFGNTYALARCVGTYVDANATLRCRSKDWTGNGTRVLDVHSTNAIKETVHLFIPVNYDGIAQVRWQAVTSNSVVIQQHGFIMPDEIYTGPVYTTISGGGGSGTSDVQTFLDLTDTPTTYSGVVGKYLRTTASGVEFGEPTGYPYAGAGIQSIKVGYKDADELYIGKGVVHINDGSDELYSVESRFAKTLTGLSNSTYYYVYAKLPTTGNVLSASEIEYTTTAPTENLTKVGYYHPSNTSWRCISVFYSDGSGDVHKFIYEDNSYRFYKTFLDMANVTVSASPANSEVIFTIPAITKFVDVFTRISAASTTLNCLYGDVDELLGSSTAYYLGAVLTDDRAVYSGYLPVSSSGTGYVGSSAGTVQARIQTTGFLLPSEIYTGPVYATISGASVGHTHSTFSGTSVHVDGDATVTGTMYAHAYDSYSPLVLKAAGVTVMEADSGAETIDFKYPITVSGSEVGAGASTFIDLTDTPTTYSGTTGKYLISTASGVEFTDAGVYPYAGAGIQSIKVEYKDDDEIYIGKGVVHIDDGSDGLYSVESRFAKTLTGLSNSSWHYVYAKPPTSGNVLTTSEIEYNTSVPSFDEDKMGYYHTTNTSWRCIGFILTSSIGVILKWTHFGDEYDFSINIGSFGWATITEDTTVALAIPFGGMIARVLARSAYLGTIYSIYISTAGESTTSKYLYTTTSAAYYPSIAILITTNSSKQVVIFASAYDAKLALYTHGFIVPDEIYTGPVYTAPADAQAFVDLTDTPSTYPTTTVSGVDSRGLIATTSGIEFTDITGDNLLINGCMRLTQRSYISATAVNNLDYSLDRWVWQQSTGGVATIYRATDGPPATPFKKCARIDVTTADASPATDAFYSLRQRIEAQNLQHLLYGTDSPKTMVLSFWVKAYQTGNFGGWLAQGDTTRNWTFGYTINSTGVWERKEIIITGDADGVINNDTGYGFQLVFSLYAGTDFDSGTKDQWEANGSTPDATYVNPSWNTNVMSSTSNYICITGVQLELGSVATNFDFIPMDELIAKCKRYYERWGGQIYNSFGMAVQKTTTTARMHAQYVRKRATPTISYGGAVRGLSAAVNALTNLSISYSSDSTSMVNWVSTDTNIAATAAVIITANNDATAYLEFDAEL